MNEYYKETRLSIRLQPRGGGLAVSFTCQPDTRGTSFQHNRLLLLFLLLLFFLLGVRHAIHVRPDGIQVRLPFFFFFFFFSNQEISNDCFDFLVKHFQREALLSNVSGRWPSTTSLGPSNGQRPNRLTWQRIRKITFSAGRE